MKPDKAGPLMKIAILGKREDNILNIKIKFIILRQRY